MIRKDPVVLQQLQHLNFNKNVNHCIKMKRGASIRKTNAILRRLQFASSQTSVCRIAKRLNLKWYKKRKAQN